MAEILRAAILCVPALVSGCGDDGAGVDGGATDAAADARVPAWRTFVSVERWARLEPQTMHTMAAYQPFHLDAALPRYVQVDEHCGYHEEDWRVPDRPMPSLGTVTMTTPLLGEITWTGNGYDAPQGQWGWDTGDPVRIVASGGELPGFEVEDVVPAQAILTTYDLFTVRALDIEIPRAAPLSLAWDRGGAEPEVFALFLQFDDASYLGRGVWCLFPAAPGTAQVPAELLAHLLPSTQILNTNFYFGGASRKDLPVGAMDVQMLTWKAQAARVRVR